MIAERSARSLTSADVDVHGWLTVRLEGVGTSDLEAVASALGMPIGPVAGTPDVRVRYVDRVLDPGAGWALGAGEAAFDEGRFVLTRGRWERSVAVMLPLPDLGEGCIEIECEHGVGRPPLLTQLLNLAAVRRGGLALHASAFVHEGQGVLVTGWSKGGKTELLLGCVARGARYVADEWAYVTPDGLRVGGLGEPVRVWDWHLEALPQYRPRLRAVDRARLRTIGSAVRAMEVAAARGPGRRRQLARAVSLLERQRHVDVEPSRLLNAPQGPGSGPLDTVAIATVVRSNRVRAYDVDPDDVALRAAASLAHERAPLAEALHMARFAFPREAWPSLEELNALETERLRALLATKRTIRVEHPYPVPIEASSDALLGAIS